MLKYKLVAMLAVILTGCSVASNLTAVQTSSVGSNEPSRSLNVLGEEIGDVTAFVPLHLAVPNLDVTAEYAETQVRGLFAGSTITNLTVVSTTFQWAIDNLSYVSPTYLPQSQLFGVTVEGALTLNEPVTYSGQIPQGSKAYCAVDVETGDILAVRLIGN